MYETKRLEYLLPLFNVDKKRQLKQYCKDLEIHSNDFVALIFLGHDGALGPYRYANHFMDEVPQHLYPNAKEHAAIQDAKAGPSTGGAEKFIRRVRQLFEERRCVSAHLFYTPCHTYWNLFHFDQRDRSAEDNHWTHGPHIHMISSLWPGHTLKELWGKVISGDRNFPSGLHIRYLEDEDPF